MGGCGGRRRGLFGTEGGKYLGQSAAQSASSELLGRLLMGMSCLFLSVFI